MLDLSGPLSASFKCDALADLMEFKVAMGLVKKLREDPTLA